MARQQNQLIAAAFCKVLSSTTTSETTGESSNTAEDISEAERRRREIYLLGKDLPTEQVHGHTRRILFFNRKIESSQFHHAEFLHRGEPLHLFPQRLA